MLVEARQPGLFKSIILLDPPIFSSKKLFLFSLLKKLGVGHLFTPAKKSMKRREVFSSQEEGLKYFASKGLFKEIPRSTLNFMSTMV